MLIVVSLFDDLRPFHWMGPKSWLMFESSTYIFGHALLLTTYCAAMVLARNSVQMHHSYAFAELAKFPLT